MVHLKELFGRDRIRFVDGANRFPLEWIGAFEKLAPRNNQASGEAVKDPFPVVRLHLSVSGCCWFHAVGMMKITMAGQFRFSFCPPIGAFPEQHH